MSTRSTLKSLGWCHLYRETLDGHIYLEIDPRHPSLRGLYTDRQIWPPTLKKSRTGY